jgi:hypothetical protein
MWGAWLSTPGMDSCISVSLSYESKSKYMTLDIGGGSDAF